MFSKIDKKLLIILIVFFVVVLLLGYAVYKYVIIDFGTKVQNETGGAQLENTQNPDENNNSTNSAPQVEVQTDKGSANTADSGSFSVCIDECGNGICQASDPNCDKKSMNCICPEAKADCPEDCK
jgi:flagellar basal body-associated protein FliL